MSLKLFCASSVRCRSLTSWCLLNRLCEKLFIFGFQWLIILWWTFGCWWSVYISSKNILFGSWCLIFNKGGVLGNLLCSIFILLVFNILLSINRNRCLCCSKVVTNLTFIHQQLCLAGRNLKCTLRLRDIQAHIRLSHLDIHKASAVHLGWWVYFSGIH